MSPSNSTSSLNIRPHSVASQPIGVGGCVVCNHCLMSAFTEAELAYLRSQRLGRIATSSNGQPHVVPLAFRYNPETDTIDVGGHGFAQRKRYRDVQRNPRVGIVIDDLASVDPWRARMIEIRGRCGDPVHRWRDDRERL